MRVLVCGTRYYSDGLKFLIQSELERRKDIKVIIEGGAKGADSLAAEWACATQGCQGAVELETYPAEWNKHGPSAGPKRNQRMLDEGKPDLVLAFHTDPGLGKGTADMVRRAKKAGVPVEVFLVVK